MPRFPKTRPVRTGFGATGRSQNVPKPPTTIGITITTPGFFQVQQLIDRLNPSLNENIWNVGLSRIVLHLQAETVKPVGGFIRHGAGKDAPALPDILTNRHGGSGLVGSIAPDYTGLPRLASLGSDLPYAGIHEDSKRAYLLPTYDKAERLGELTDLMLETIEELSGLRRP